MSRSINAARNVDSHSQSGVKMYGALAQNAHMQRLIGKATGRSSSFQLLIQNANKSAGGK